MQMVGAGSVQRAAWSPGSRLQILQERSFQSTVRPSEAAEASGEIARHSSKRGWAPAEPPQKSLTRTLTLQGEAVTDSTEARGRGLLSKFDR